MTPPTPPLNLELEKEEIVQQLCTHYAQDHLSTQDLEVRFERVMKAPDRATLYTVLEGLPALPRHAAMPAPMYEVASARAPIPASAVRRYAAFMSGLKKEGHWTPAPHAKARVIMGNVLLDLREAVIPPEGITLDAEVYLGEFKVILPPGIGADVECSAFMGEATDKAQAGHAGAPRVRVTGFAFMGTIIVVTKMPKKERLEDWRATVKRWLGAGGG